jgi:GntR family transcriptional repressor for pyruvate dehydrogenase complex
MKYAIKITNKTKCDQVVEQIKDFIIKGVYKTGDKLPPEPALCEMFGVSRITIRESLKKLNMMGLVDIRQGSGTYVKNVDLGTFMQPLFQLIDFEDIDIETIYNAREIIEGGTAYLAAINRTDEECKELEQILTHMKDANKARDIILSRQFDSEFHIKLSKMSHNTLLQACVATIEEINQACVKRISKLDVILEGNYSDHYEIYQQIKNRNPEGAKRAMIAHTIASKNILLD